jgi:hypothetical protein
MLLPLTPLLTPARWGLWDARKTLELIVADHITSDELIKIEQKGFAQGP